MAHIDNCDDAKDRLYHFLDGELDHARRSDIQRHLDACHHCFEAFDFEAELRQVVARKCQDRVPDALRSRIAVALQHEFNSRSLDAPRPPAGGMPGS